MQLFSFFHLPHDLNGEVGPNFFEVELPGEILLSQSVSLEAFLLEAQPLEKLPLQRLCLQRNRHFDKFDWLFQFRQF